MSEQNKDGTWKLPDASVSLVWQREDGVIIHKRLASDDSWYGPYFVGCKGNPPAGRWLPWQPPTFPARKKTELRRAKVRFQDREYLAVRSQSKPEYPWTLVYGEYWICREDQVVHVLQWLDPEYEDEAT